MAGLYPAYYAAAAGDPPESMSPIGVVPTQERDDEMELHELEPPHIEEQHQETPVQNDHETVELHEIDNFEHGAAPASQPAPAAAPAASPARSPPPAHTKHHHHQHHHHTQHHHGHHKHHAPEKATPSPANAQPAQAQAEGPVRWGAPRTDDFQDIEAASQPAVYIPPKSTATTTVNPDPGADMFYGGKHTPSRPTYSSHKVDNGPNATLHIVLVRLFAPAAPSGGL